MCFLIPLPDVLHDKLLGATIWIQKWPFLWWKFNGMKILICLLSENWNSMTNLSQYVATVGILGQFYWRKESSSVGVDGAKKAQMDINLNLKCLILWHIWTHIGGYKSSFIKCVSNPRPHQWGQSNDPWPIIYTIYRAADSGIFFQHLYTLEFSYLWLVEIQIKNVRDILLPSPRDSGLFGWIRPEVNGKRGVRVLSQFLTLHHRGANGFRGFLWMLKLFEVAIQIRIVGHLILE